MPKAVKILALLLLPLVLAGGVFVGLVKKNVLPGHKWAAQHGPLGIAMKLMGIRPALVKKSGRAPAPSTDPLAAEKQALQAEQQALAKEQSDWQAQKQQEEQALQHPAAPPAPAIDPQQIARLADIYGKMDSATIIKIFSKMPDAEEVALLRQMSGRKVAHVLAGLGPDRAAQITGELAAAPAAAPQQTAMTQ